MVTSSPPERASGKQRSRVLDYLGSGRNLAGCAAGAGGLVLHFAGLGGAWWPGVVVGLYGAAALLVPGRPKPGGGGAGGPGGSVGSAAGPGAVAGGSPEVEAVSGGVSVHVPRGRGGAGGPRVVEVEVPRSPAGPGAVGAGAGAGPVGAAAGAGAGAVAGAGRGEAAVWDPQREVDGLFQWLSSVPVPHSAGLDELLDRLREASPASAEARHIARWRLPVAVDGYLRSRTWQPWTPDASDPAEVLGREVGLMSAVLAA